MEGWKCPGCGKCFAPSVTECSTCGKETVTRSPDMSGFFADQIRHCSFCGDHYNAYSGHACAAPPTTGCSTPHSARNTD